MAMLTRVVLFIVLGVTCLFDMAHAAAPAEPPILRTVDEALAFIETADVTEGLELYVADELWKDPPGTEITGVRIAIVMNAVFMGGLLPGDPAIQKDGYRIYKFVPRSKFVLPSSS